MMLIVVVASSADLYRVVAFLLIQLIAIVMVDYLDFRSNVNPIQANLLPVVFDLYFRI